MGVSLHHRLRELTLVHHGCLVLVIVSRRAYGTKDGLQKCLVKAPRMTAVVRRRVAKFNVCCSNTVSISLVPTSPEHLFLGLKSVRLELYER